MTEDTLQERYDLALSRIAQIPGEGSVPAPYTDFFERTAAFVLMLDGLRRDLQSGAAQEWTLEKWQDVNHRLYEDILPENYDHSYANPAYAVSKTGKQEGKLLSFLYAQLRGLIGYIFEAREEETVPHLELFVEIYNCFEQKPLPPFSEIRQILYWFESDYCDVFKTRRIRENLDPSLDFAVKIIMESDLNDLRYLYRYGEYITRSELELASFLNSLPEEKIRRMADTYTEGMRMGFVRGGKDLSRKRTVNIRFQAGFERIVRAAVENFARMGLKPTIYRHAMSVVNKTQTYRVGFCGADPNPQYGYDHKEDAALYLDAKFSERVLGVIRSAYETYSDLAAVFAGPAVMETFGEDPFAPAETEDAWKLSQRQQALQVSMSNEAARITNQYIDGKQRSFTIISFPTPQIGKDFREIFEDTIRINTLDEAVYKTIQEKLIDVLNQGKTVRILGQGGNRTDLTVALHSLNDPEKETLFENCLADVNIPVGEVFTSPRLEGTNGVLHVSSVFLEGLHYKDLEITFKDGMTDDYRCGNFSSEEENREYIQSNVLFHHEALPLGEFAIGTNTTAYAVSRKYGIEARMPILIAEKTGPHFAVGDTCYSFEEDNRVFNPDGKEIIAKENSVSALRKTSPEKAYFGCHTDITLPYEELGLLEVITGDGRHIPLIREGRFVLPGTELLNEVLDEA